MTGATTKTKGARGANDLLAAISRRRPSSGGGADLVMPGAEVYRRLASDTKKEIAAIRKEIGDSEAEELRLPVLRQTFETAKANHALLQAQAQTALEVEKTFFEAKIAEQDTLMQTTRDEIKQKAASFDRIKGLGRALHRDGRRALNSLLAQYPHAQLIDLSCLEYFRLENGLPALTLFSVDKPLSVITVNHEKLAFEAAESRPEGGFFNNTTLMCSRSSNFCRNLARSICIATGVLPQPTGEVFRDNIFSREELPGATAWNILLTTDFSYLQGAVPPEARTLIKKAKESGQFECLLLLAEVRRWDIEYRGLTGTPKIQGISRPRPITQDPLIIGVKKILNRDFPFLIGAFDTTPLETLLHREFCVKP